MQAAVAIISPSISFGFDAELVQLLAAAMGFVAD